MKKLITTYLLVFITQITFSQKEFSLKLDQVTKEELLMTTYEKDSTANSVVLNDFGNTYIDEENNFRFRTDYYYKIKFFNKKDIEKATFKFRLVQNQKLKNIKAITYKLKGDVIKKTFLLDSQIYTKQISENVKEVSFTMPNIESDCVVEYVYSFINPFSGIRAWRFQSDIPVKNSELRVSVPGNWRYNTRIIGYKKLDKNEASIKKECLYVPGIANAADCSVVTYGMQDLPAFKEEDYMLSKKNFMSRLVFEMISFTDPRGITTKYTKTWDDADKFFKNQLFDKQTSKKVFFKNQLPEEISTVLDPLEKAKKIFYFVQKKMFWNESYYLSSKVRVKEAYDKNEGSIAEINLILYNFLKALGVKSDMAVLSTRDNGLPTKLHPSTEVFNYAIVKAVIEGKTYFLDATNKFLPFGEVPMECLNGDARVLDFKKGSYWETIVPRFKTSNRSQFQLAFDEDNSLKGTLITSNQGYFAVGKRYDLKNKTKDEYLEDFETDYPNVEVDDVEITNLKSNEKSLKLKYDINVDVDEFKGRVIINPFLFNQIKENPFKLKERLYPVDYATKLDKMLIFNFNIPNDYVVKSIPESISYSLPNNGGKYSLRVNKTDKKISLIMRFSIGKKIFSSDEYYYLKEFYNKIIKSQANLIVLQKLN